MKKLIRFSGAKLNQKVVSVLCILVLVTISVAAQTIQ